MVSELEVLNASNKVAAFVAGYLKITTAKIDNGKVLIVAIKYSGIIAHAAVNYIVSGAAAKDVVAFATIEDVISHSAVQAIVAVVAA